MEKEFDFKNIGKRMPYRTPDGFFGKMQKQVLERTQACLLYTSPSPRDRT